MTKSKHPNKPSAPLNSNLTGQFVGVVAKEADKLKPLYENSPNILVPSSSGVYGLRYGDSPPTSMMRIMAFLSLVIGAAIAVIGLLEFQDLSQLAVLASVFVVPAFAGKVAQKPFETRGK